MITELIFAGGVVVVFLVFSAEVFSVLTVGVTFNFVLDFGAETDLASEATLVFWFSILGVVTNVFLEVVSFDMSFVL